MGIDIGAEALASQASQTSQISHSGVVLSQQSGTVGILSNQASQTSIGAGISLSVEMEASQSSVDQEVGRG